MLAKSIDGWFTMATETLLRFAFFNASIVDDTKDIKIRWWQSKSDAARVSTGKINAITTKSFKDMTIP